MDVYTLIDDVVTYLASQGVGTPGVDLFAANVNPQAQFTLSVVYPTGGPNSPGDPVSNPTFSIQHQNTSVRSGLSKVTEIHTMLDEAWNKLDNVTGRIYAQSQPGAFIRSSSGLYRFTLNFVLNTGQ